MKALGGVVAAACVLLAAEVAQADPCGMVPPIYAGDGGATIKRTGPQRTFVFFKDGVQDIVIRPGYTGNVEEFGMLVPLPSPPALRKVPDAIFDQIAAAVDPPEVVIDLRPVEYYPKSMARSEALAPSAASGLEIAKDEVRVLKQEAVGMYEVAVLEAGSAKALEKWMDEHKFKYPKGMDDVTNDYVKRRWCFVAVKTKVADKGATDPRPGMREKPKAGLPGGASYDGYIQGMGYRFKTEKPVIPMRLSTYNEADERRQIVYLLTKDPVKFDGVPEDRVVRQVVGSRVHRNVTKPLPLRIIGGTLKDVPKEQLAALAPQRDPKPHNGQAKELFAGNLLAARTGILEVEHEAEEKELLAIGERLGLRGPEIDVLHAEELDKAREEVAKKSIGDLQTMTLTVVDGEFPFEYMRQNDLTLSPFRMPKAKNDSAIYHARYLGAQPAWEREGVVVWDDQEALKLGDKWYQELWK